jgi:hypothetical protein
MAIVSMPVTRLHRLTTICLAALYGVVGLTGASFYYLTTDATGDSSNSPTDETVVYFHTHGPGQEGHFHRHIVHRHLSGATTDVHKARQGKFEPTIASEGTTHQPHSCAILTLVSTLKLGYAAFCTNSIILDSLVTPTWESGTISAFDVVRYSYARGPPSGSFA